MGKDRCPFDDSYVHDMERATGGKYPTDSCPPGGVTREDRIRFGIREWSDLNSANRKSGGGGDSGGGGGDYDYNPWVLKILHAPFQHVGVLMDKLGMSPHRFTRFIQNIDSLSGILLFGSNPGMKSTQLTRIHNQLVHTTSGNIFRIKNVIFKLPGSVEYAWSVLYQGDMQALAKHQEKNGLKLFRALLTAPLDQTFAEPEALRQRATLLEVVYSAMPESLRDEAKSLVASTEFTALSEIGSIGVPLTVGKKPLFKHTTAFPTTPLGINLHIANSRPFQWIRDWWTQEMYTLIDHALEHPSEAPLFTGHPIHREFRFPISQCIFARQLSTV